MNDRICRFSVRAKPGLVAVLVLTLTGCSTLGYYLQSVQGQLDLMSRRQPIEQLIADPQTPGRQRELYRTILDIRDFASRELKLPDNGSYRLYANLEREAVVWSVVATPEFSVKPETWCYPVVGCLSYRGYFGHEDAESFAAGLKEDGLDVAVNPVPAYSTLGWFDDPVPSSIMHWPEYRIAGLVFHELAHQRLYLKGKTAFNEAFATAVQRIGVERWVASRNDENLRRKWRDSLDHEREFIALLLDVRDELSILYGMQFDDTSMRREKMARFDRLGARYEVLKAERWQGYPGYDHWFERPVNNARLASVATYEALVPAFMQVYRQSAGDMQVFYAASEKLADTSEFSGQ